MCLEMFTNAIKLLQKLKKLDFKSSKNTAVGRGAPLRTLHDLPIIDISEFHGKPSKEWPNPNHFQWHSSLSQDTSMYQISSNYLKNSGL